MRHPAPALLAASLLTACPAGASATPIRQLLTGSGGQLQLSDDVFLVSKRTSAGSTLVLGVGHGQSQSGRINALNASTFSE